jgi:tRNA threonylcarbamoyladenosine biosynthesis protein TsaB
MNILAFDTATEQLCVAVHAGGRSLSRNATGGAAASAALLPLAQTLLAEAGIGYRDLHFIAFGRGPGAFTGLRTSCAVAQGLALGLGCPVLAIDSLLIVAEDARTRIATDVEPDIGVAMDARMDEIYAGRWRWSDGRWVALAPPQLLTPAALAADWAGADGPVWVAGTAPAVFGDRLPLAAQTPCLAGEGDRAAALLRLALAAAAAGEGVDAAQALPLYLRDKVAQTTLEREQARAHAGAAASP